MQQTWSQALDSLSCQLDLQERAFAGGFDAPADIEIFPPDEAMTPAQQVRAAVLFQRCEDLLDEVAARAVANRARTSSPYRGVALG